MSEETDITKENSERVCERCSCKGDDIGETPCGSVLCDDCYDKIEDNKREEL